MQTFTQVNEITPMALEHNVGEDLTDAQAAFYKEHFERNLSLVNR